MRPPLALAVARRRRLTRLIVGLSIAVAVGVARPRAQDGTTGTALVERGRALVVAGRVDEAEPLFERADALLLEARDLQALGALRTDRALRAFTARRFDDAERLWLAALDAFERDGDLAAQARTLRSLCFLPRTAVDARLALATEAVSRAHASGDVDTEGAARHMRSDLLFVRGNLEGAWRELQDALRLLESLPPSTHLGNALTSAGRLYRILGRPKEAVAIQQRTAAMLERIGDLSGAAQALDAATRAQLDRPGDSAAEVRMATDALTMARRSGDARWLTTCAGRLARALARAGRAREGLALFDEAGVHPAQSVWMFHNERSAVLQALGRQAEALGELDAVVAARLDLPAFDRVILASNRAVLLRRLGREAEAVAESERALGLIDAMAGQLLPDDASKRGFFEQMRSVFDSQILLLGAAGRTEDALAAAERGRSRAFLDLLASRRIQFEAGDVPSRPDALAADRPPSLHHLSSGSLEALLASVADTGREAEPDVANTGSAPPATVDEVRAIATDLRTHVLAYWVSDDTTSIWVVAPGGAVTLARHAVGHQRLAALARAAASTGPEARPALRALYDALIAPVRSALPSSPGALVTVIPHGPLFRVSFAALQDRRGRYLLEDFRLHYASSVGALAATPRPRHGGGPALVVADPENPAVPPGSPANTRLQPLPAARQEARSLRTLLRPRQVDVLMARAATEGHVRAALHDASVVHLATHGVVSDDAPWTSFLALRAGGASGDDDGRLTAAELYDLSLTADLVVLGACRSAVGPETGDGLTGLTRGFFAAGVPSVVASLWDVPDETTARLQPAFYRQWLRSASPSEALRTAQLALLRDLRAGRVVAQTAAGPVVVPEHPTAWAGLVAIGRP